MHIISETDAFAAVFLKDNQSNALAALEGIKLKVEELNREVLEPVGLHMEQSFDASLYINRAVGMVTANLGLGVLLSCAILWVFLRQLKATLMIAVAIPISIMLTFGLLKVMGRTLNVISLAGIAFALLAAVAARGVRTARVTLHVGAGTFQPVRVENLAEHRMHSERFQLSADTAQAIADTRAAGGRVIAVGTTSLRCLESAAAACGDGQLTACSGDTRLFITPGYDFRVIDGLLTNFHLPKSTLLMLVSALAGQRRIRAAYAHAVGQRYRFFSYGDAMFIPARMKDTDEV